MCAHARVCPGVCARTREYVWPGVCARVRVHVARCVHVPGRVCVRVPRRVCARAHEYVWPGVCVVPGVCARTRVRVARCVRVPRRVCARTRTCGQACARACVFVCTRAPGRSHIHFKAPLVKLIRSPKRKTENPGTTTPVTQRGNRPREGRRLPQSHTARR